MKDRCREIAYKMTGMYFDMHYRYIYLRTHDNLAEFGTFLSDEPELIKGMVHRVKSYVALWAGEVWKDDNEALYTFLSQLEKIDQVICRKPREEEKGYYVVALNPYEVSYEELIREDED